MERDPSDLDDSATPPPVLEYMARRTTVLTANPFAIASLACGGFLALAFALTLLVALTRVAIPIPNIVANALVVLWFAAAVAAIVLGILGQRRARLPGTAGRGPASLGIALGILALLWAGLNVAVAIFMRQTYGPDGGLNRFRCAEHLREVGAACGVYARANSGRFPPDFAALVLGGTLSDGDLVCPTATSIGVTPVPSGPVNPQNYSYSYAGAGLKISTPPGTILAYEKIENHEGRGIHLLYADGRVVWIDRREAAHLVDELKAGHNPPR